MKKEEEMFVAQEVLKNALIAKHDKRVGKGAEKVFEAAKQLHLSKVQLTKVEVAKYIEKHFGGSPALGTLNNDTKDVYGQIIDSFIAIGNYSCDLVKEPPAESVGELAAKVGVLQRELALQKRYSGQLNGIIEKNFSGIEKFSTNKVLTNPDLNPSTGISVQDGIVEEALDDKTLRAFTKLYKNLLDNQVLVEAGSTNIFIADMETGDIILEPEESALVLDCVRKMTV